MKTIEEKLKSIEDSCLKLANQDNENLKQEINDKIQAEINEELILYKNKLEKKKKNAFEKMEKEYNSNLWKLENESKQKIIDAEKILKNQLYEELCEKMKAFVLTDEYQDFLRNNIIEAQNMILNKSNLVICVTNKDKDRFFNIIQQYSNNIETLDDSCIGGCIVKNTSEIIDNTILMNLKEKVNEYENNI